MPSPLRRAGWLAHDSGQGLVEYALILALTSVGLVVALLVLRDTAGNSFRTTSNRLDAASSTPGYLGGGSNPGPTGSGGGTSGTGGSHGGGNGQGNSGNGLGNGGPNGGNNGNSGAGNQGNGNGNNGSGRH
jgi:Flp pilus assembly pilin Flp